MMQLVMLVTALAGAVSAQFFPHQELSVAVQPPPVQQQFAHQQFAPQQRAAFVPQQQQGFAAQPNYAHRAVIQNAQREAQLPAHLLNPFYKNQRIAGALAKESWFIPGENLVVDREAEKIPRQMIYSVLKNAGLVNRRRR